MAIASKPALPRSAILDPPFAHTASAIVVVDLAGEETNEELRSAVLSEIARHTGQCVTWRLIKQTSDFVAGVDRFHNLITGIYKPAWSDYALSIVMQIKSPYERKDESVFLKDGRWLMTYSPRAGGLSLSDNQALVRCMDARVPLGVFRQLTDRADPHGSTYRVLGLGLITEYDAKRDVFIVESADRSALEQVTSVVGDERKRYEVQIYAQLTNEFRLYAKEEDATYIVSAPKRDEAFRRVVLQGYDFTCAVCEAKFRLGDIVEATAAHIVPKRERGTDDPRNGLALCRTHHWAFDMGIFALSDSYEVLLSPVVHYADTRNFDLLHLAGRSVLLPENDALRPHTAALIWHRANVWQTP